MLVYAAVGLVLMWLTRLIFDKVSLPSFSVKDEIARGNNAVAIVDAGNMVATAVMVRAVMNWSEGGLSSGLMAVAVGYVATQIILTLTTVYRVKLFRMRNREGAGFQDVVRAGNMAVAMRFVGFQVGVALAVTAASGVAVFQAGGDPIVQGLTWGGVSIVMGGHPGGVGPDRRTVGARQDQRRRGSRPPAEYRRRLNGSRRLCRDRPYSHQSVGLTRRRGGGCFGGGIARIANPRKRHPRTGVDPQTP